MADLFANLKFKVDGLQALENAKKAMVDSGQGIKQMGQTFNQMFDDIKKGNPISDAAKQNFMALTSALGELDSTAKNSRGQLRDYTQTLTDLTMRYRELSDEEKSSDFGKAMAQSIQQLTEKAGTAKDAMMDVSAAITNAASDTRMFDQLAGGATLMTSGFETLTGAAQLFGVEMGDNVEVIATLQSAMAITNGLQTIQNTLQGQSAVMQGVLAARAALAAAAQTTLAAATGSATAAQTAFNLVAKANPYVLLASAVAAVGTALYAFASASSKAKKEEEELEKQAEETRKAVDEQKKAFVDNASVAASDASQIRSLQIQYAKANTEIQKTSILQQAADKFKKLGYEVNGLNDAQQLLTKYGTTIVRILTLQGTAAAISAMRMEAFKKSFQSMLENGYDVEGATILASANSQVRAMDSELASLQSEIAQLQGSLPKGHSGGGSHSSGSGSHSSGGSTSGTKAEPLIKNTAPWYEAQIKDLQDKLDKTTDMSVRARIQANIDEYKTQLKNLQSETDAAAVAYRYRNGGYGQGFYDSNIGIGGTNNLKAPSGELIDTSKGMERMKYEYQHTPDDDEEKKKKKNDYSETGFIGFASDLQGGLSSLAGGLEEFGLSQDSGFAKIIDKMGAVITIITSIQSIVTAIEAINTIGSFIPFARGGVVHAAGGVRVPGNYMSGDRVPAMLNSGELVLNRAQQGNIASQLQGSGFGQMQLSATIKGEDIRLALNNNSRRRGKGEYVTSRA